MFRGKFLHSVFSRIRFQLTWQTYICPTTVHRDSMLQCADIIFFQLLQGTCYIQIRHYAIKEDSTSSRGGCIVQSGEFEVIRGRLSENYSFANCRQLFAELNGGEWTMRRYKDYPKTEIGAEKAWARAAHRLGEDEYSLLRNNCEHFVTKVLSGKAECVQINNVSGSSSSGPPKSEVCVIL